MQIRKHEKGADFLLIAARGARAPHHPWGIFLNDHHQLSS